MNTINQNLPTCLSRGFSYTKSNVKFTTPDGDEVTMRLHQSISGDRVFDSKILSTRIKCNSCSDGSDALKAANRLVYGLGNVVVNNMKVEVEIYSLIDRNSINTADVKSLNSDTSIITTTKNKYQKSWEFAKDIFAGVTAGSVLEVGKSLLEDLSDKFHSEPPIIIVEDSNGKPIGSGRLRAGKLVMDVSLKPNGNPGESEWRGTVSADLANRIDKSWSDYIVRGFGGGGACTITKTGMSGSEEMTMKITCW